MMEMIPWSLGIANPQWILPVVAQIMEAFGTETTQLYQFPIRLFDLKPNHCQFAVLDSSDEYQLPIKPTNTKRKKLENLQTQSSNLCQIDRTQIDLTKSSLQFINSSPDSF